MSCVVNVTPLSEFAGLEYYTKTADVPVGFPADCGVLMRPCTGAPFFTDGGTTRLVWALLSLPPAAAAVSHRRHRTRRSRSLRSSAS